MFDANEACNLAKKGARNLRVRMGAESTEKPQTTQGVVLPTTLKTPFRGILLTGVVLEDRSYVVEGTLFRIYLQLSGTPPLGWAFMFASVWQAEQPKNVSKPRSALDMCYPYFIRFF